MSFHLACASDKLQAKLLPTPPKCATLEGMSGLVGTKGASGIWQRIISEMPEHDVYIEPFWGRGTIAKRMRRPTIVIGIDLDPASIQSGRAAGALMFLGDGVQWIQDYFYIDQPGDAGSSDAAGGRGRLPSTFGGAPWSRHFIYLDPPYLGFTGYYAHELTEDQHRGLCRIFRRLPCPAALSGYRSGVYSEELGDTRSIDIPTVNRAGRRVIETVWFNYPQPRRYHDTRFVGVGRRERERIRRRVRNWSVGLLRMTPAERQAVLEECNRICLGTTENLPNPTDQD